MKKILFVLMAALTLWGCSEKDSGTPDDTLYQLVTYEGTNEETHVSLFTYQVIDDSPLISLTCAFEPTKKIELGTRLLIGYTTDTPGESGPITLKSASTVLGGTLEAQDNASVQSSRPIVPVSIWRTGNYLNIIARVALNSGAATASLTYAPTTPTNLCLVVRQATDLGIEAVERTIYCSWDISAVIASPSLTLQFKAINGENQTFEIKK